MPADDPRGILHLRKPAASATRSFSSSSSYYLTTREVSSLQAERPKTAAEQLRTVSDMPAASRSPYYSSIALAKTSSSTAGMAPSMNSHRRMREAALRGDAAGLQRLIDRGIGRRGRSWQYSCWRHLLLRPFPIEIARP